MRRLSVSLILFVVALSLIGGSATTYAAGDDGQGNPASAPNGRNGGVAIQGEPVKPAPYGRRDPGPASTPEAPFAMLLPLVGVAAAGGAWYLVSLRRQHRHLL